MPFQLPKWFGSEDKGARASSKEIQLMPLTKKIGKTAEQKNARNTFLTMPSPLPDTKTLTSPAPKKQSIQDRLIYYIEQSCHFNILPFIALNIFEFVFYNNKHHLPDDISDRPKLLKAIQSPKVFHTILKLHQKYHAEKNLSPTIKYSMGVLFRILSFGLLSLSFEISRPRYTMNRVKDIVETTNELKLSSFFVGDNTTYPTTPLSLELVDQLNTAIRGCCGTYSNIGLKYYKDWGCMETFNYLILPHPQTFLEISSNQIHSVIRRKIVLSIIPAIREFGFFGLLLQSCFFTHVACCISETGNLTEYAKYYFDKAIYTVLLASYLMLEFPHFYNHKIISPRSAIFSLINLRTKKGIDIHAMNIMVDKCITSYHQKMHQLAVQNISARFFALNKKAMNTAEGLITHIKQTQAPVL